MRFVLKVLKRRRASLSSTGTGETVETVAGWEAGMRGLLKDAVQARRAGSLLVEALVVRVEALEHAVTTLCDRVSVLEKRVAEGSASVWSNATQNPPASLDRGPNVVDLFAPRRERAGSSSETPNGEGSLIDLDEAVRKRQSASRRLRVFQDRLSEIIDNHHEALAESIDGLGCGGDCYRCPHPETITVDTQVRKCLTSAVNGLDLDRSLLEESDEP